MIHTYILYMQPFIHFRTIQSSMILDRLQTVLGIVVSISVRTVRNKASDRVTDYVRYVRIHDRDAYGFYSRICTYTGISSGAMDDFFACRLVYMVYFKIQNWRQRFRPLLTQQLSYVDYEYVRKFYFTYI